MIETARLKIVPVTIEHFNALRENAANIGDLLQVKVIEGWLQFPEVIEYSINYLREHPESLNWWMQFFIHKNDNALIGCGGFKGAPDENGAIEIGYEIALAYQNQGLAAEAARGLAEFAFADARVLNVDAHTLAEKNASCRVLEKIGMRKIAEKHDAEDGDVWQWRVARADYQPL